MPDPDPEPMPPEGYDDRLLPKQPETVDHPTCHVCPERTPRVRHHGAWLCPKCDTPTT